MEDTQNLTHRTTFTTPTTDADPTVVQTTTVNDGHDKEFRGRQKALVFTNPRGLKTMGLAVAVPVFLTLLNIYYFGSNNNYLTTTNPSWVPPAWALHVLCVGSACLMGLSGWMVWAEDGFHRKPGMMGLYLGQLGLGLVWNPVVFWMRANGVGLLVGLAQCYALWQCYMRFRQVYRVAGDLILPCLGWAGLLAFVNLKFLLS